MSLPPPPGHWTFNLRRPSADFVVAPQILERWKRVHRGFQLALAVALAHDPAVRELSAWRGEDPAGIVITPTLPYVAEGGVGIAVSHRISARAAFGPDEIESTHSRTELRLSRDAVWSKDGDPRTWHAVTDRAARLIEEFAYLFGAAPGNDKAALRVAGQTLSGLRGEAYDDALAALAENDPRADNLVYMLGAPLR